MDLYNEEEQILSSDEYSEDYDEDDALLNEAIKSQSSYAVLNPYCTSSPLYKSKIIDQKNKELSSLIRRNKIFIIYKNKAIKWLNKKKQRERYKTLFHRNRKCSFSFQTNNYIATDAGNTSNRTGTLNVRDRNAPQQDTLSKLYLAPQQNSLSKVKLAPIEISGHCEKAEDKLLQAVSEKNQEEVLEIKSRSSSPFKNETKEEESDNKTSKNEIKIDTPQFYKQINEMFPKFDEVIKGHIDCITNDTITTTDEKMKCILNEIQTLNELIRNKESEWNRLIHLKMIKEEIYTRLSRKKHALHLEAEGNSNIPSGLNELQLCPPDTQNRAVSRNSLSSSIQQIIEKRANMKSEDLKRESSGTSRLHSLLVSHKILPTIEPPDFTFKNNGELNFSHKNSSFGTSQESHHQQHLGNGTFLSNGRKEDYKDWQSLTKECRQRTMNFPQTTKPFPFAKDRKSSTRQFEELARTPIANAKKKGINQDLILKNSLFRSKNVGPHVGNSVLNFKRNLKTNSSKKAQYPFCQQCKIHESRFVCAGCGNQWYCSKICQISAWDKHSESCTD